MFRPREGVSPSRVAGVRGRRIWPSEQLVDGEQRRWLRSPSLPCSDLGVSPVEEAILLGVLPTDFGGWGDQALL